MTAPQPATDGEAMSDLEKAADQAIEARGGDARAAVIGLLVANDFLERELEVRRIEGFTLLVADWSSWR
jgi:hypothetical protein